MPDFVIAVGGGRIVEIAADNDGIFTTVDMSVNGNTLLLSGDEGRFDFLEDFLGFLIEERIVKLAVKNLFAR